jgi:hypothetical protein
LRATPVGGSKWAFIAKFRGFDAKLNPRKASNWAYIFHASPNFPSKPPFLEGL